MASIKLVFAFRDEKALLAESVADEMHGESNMRVEKIGPGRVEFERTLEKYKIKTFPAIIVAGSGQLNEVKIEGEKYFKDRETLKKEIIDALFAI